MSYAAVPKFWSRDRWSKKDTASILVVVCREYGAGGSYRIIFTITITINTNHIYI
jgi:hypothetical protein